MGCRRPAKSPPIDSTVPLPFVLCSLLFNSNYSSLFFLIQHKSQLYPGSKLCFLLVHIELQDATMVNLFKKKDKRPTLSTKFSKLVVDKLEGEDGKEANLMVTSFKENDVTSPTVVVKAESTNEYTTPTGKEYRILEPLTCPPAPRLKKCKVFSCSSNVDDKEYVALPELEAVLALNHVFSFKIA